MIQSVAVANKAIEFFESEIHPILVDHCYSCHSHEADKIKGGLVLDSRAGLLKGGDSGPVIVPGDPDRSLLIKAVRYTDEELQMPPKNKKLSAAQIAALEDWVKMGAPDPREGKTVDAVDMSAARKHWAFQPLTTPSVPLTKNKWARTPIDAFILAKLDENKLKPAPAADKRTLIRRASYGLTGLPPTFEEVEAFLKDKSSDAFAKVVDRLLASPHYGERWGRHWLDVARYSDTKGIVYDSRDDKRFVHSYAYRDWVIRALNDDMPYDKFVKLQLAADQISGTDRDALAAMGFLTVGRKFLGITHEIIDDRIDVATRGLLGLTVSCARCHDHKYDPVPTADYYSLYGVFAGSQERTVPLNAATQDARAYLEFEKGLREREETYRTAFNEKRAELARRLRMRITDYLTAALDAKKWHTEEFYSFVQGDELNPVIVRRWHVYLLATKDKFDPIWSPWHAFEKLPQHDFAARAGTVMASFTNPKQKLNPVVQSVFATNTPTSMKAVAEIYGRLLGEVDNKWTDAGDKSKALSKDEEALRQVLYAAHSPAVVPDGALVDMEWLFDEPTRVALGKLSREIDKWIVESPGAPPYAVILEDRAVQQNPRIFIRGNAAQKGPEVPRQFLEILDGENRKPFENGSGRLELAEAIARRDNPLTARVLVNRVWMHHFGEGLVRTTSDFGTRCEPPTHPELLDWLARWFMDNGWSLKKLHRLIMTSAVYQQSSLAENIEVDPENKLLSRFNRQRLDLEALRDSVLMVSGELDFNSGGRGDPMFAETYSKRRAVYGYIDREFVPGTMRVFDFPTPDMHSPQRSETTIPQQALFFMNGTFVMKQAKALATVSTNSAAELTKLSEEKRLRDLYRRVYQREPTPRQLRVGLEFVRSAAAAPAESVAETPKNPNSLDWRYGYGDFDAKTKQLNKFETLPFFTGTAWQGGPAWPDAALGWLQLTATGGHAGNTIKQPVIRRWVSPVKGTVSVSGTLKHERAPGHGIRAYILSNRHGLLGSWTLHNKSAEAKRESITVQPGDTLDFIVSIHSSLSHNDFLWSPMIRMVGDDAIEDANGYAKEWSAEKDFAGTQTKEPRPLDAWEKYAQVLLLSNEFVFVD